VGHPRKKNPRPTLDNRFKGEGGSPAERRKNKSRSLAALGMTRLRPKPTV
jgi:hypothetical protein